jgi:hypothetical protein
MAGINWKRVIGAGIAAGLLYDILEISLSPLLAGRQFEAELNLVRHTPPSPAGYAFFFGWGFAIGLVAMFFYAAVRPRLGPGPRTAAAVAFALWILADLMPHFGNAFMGIFTMGLMVRFALQQLFFIVATTIFGAWLYKET